MLYQCTNCFLWFFVTFGTELYASQPDSPMAADRDRKAHLLRIQTLMLALFPHFIISEPLMRKLKGFGLSSQGDARYAPFVFMAVSSGC